MQFVWFLQHDNWPPILFVSKSKNHNRCFPKGETVELFELPIVEGKQKILRRAKIRKEVLPCLKEA